MLGQGCGDSQATALDESDDGGANAADFGEPPPSELIADAGVPKAQYQGSPLCRITETTCNPDDDGTRADYGDDVNVTCAIAPSDAGPASEPKGCRVSSSSSGRPQCAEATPENGDGAKCAAGSDCAPGFDCVAGDGASGVCRRYCCAGSCASNRSQNGGDTFCDVQKLHKDGDKVPVCMPLKTCELLAPGECAETETCGIVTEDGATGCVANGSAGVDRSCDEEHCNVGLTCLGQPGSRKCYQLCRTAGSPSCGSTKICKTSTIFKDPSVGVCVEP